MAVETVVTVRTSRTIVTVVIDVSTRMYFQETYIDLIFTVRTVGTGFTVVMLWTVLPEAKVEREQIREKKEEHLVGIFVLFFFVFYKFDIILPSP